jgi:hypothetical protein
MDENKKEKLKEIGYKIAHTCGLCKYGMFKPKNAFGDCLKFSYKHLKHVEPSKNLSVNIYGSCKEFQLSEEENVKLMSYIEFFDFKKD